MLKKIFGTICTLALAAFVLYSANVEAKPGPGCGHRDNGCQVTNITFTAVSNPDPPIVPCPNTVSLYRLDATVSCGLSIGGGTAVSGLVCPVTNQPVIVTAEGKTHTFEPTAGRTWQNVIDDCDSLSYSAN